MTDLPPLEAALVVCRRCPRLVAWRESIAIERRASYRDQIYWGRPVPGFGDPSARVLLVGLAPAAHGANRTGRMFTGDRSGDFLFASLHRTGFASQPTSEHVDDGLELTDCYVTSAVKCAPPHNKPTRAEESTCAEWLTAEVALFQPAVVVALGRLGYGAVRRLADGRGWAGLPATGFGHGVELATVGGPTVLCSYHPSQQNTFTGRLTPSMLDGVFRRASDLLMR